MADFADALAFSAYEEQISLCMCENPSDSSRISLLNKSTPVQATTRMEPLSQRDSGIWISDSEDSHHSLNRKPSLKKTPTKNEPLRLQSPDGYQTFLQRSPSALRRPRELSLSSPLNKSTLQTDHSNTPAKSELELRFELVRQSSTRNRAALRSPSQLLNHRLGLSPKGSTREPKLHVFTPPRPMLNGCILPPPQQALQPFSGTSVRARTLLGAPAWWCKFDRVVVFDGVEDATASAAPKYLTRSSKGLTIARRNGTSEVVMVPLDCTHCQEMLGREDWKYDVRVCRRSVCWECRERCRWEMDFKKKQESGDGKEDADANSLDESYYTDVISSEKQPLLDLDEKAGIEHVAPMVGIEEALEAYRKGPELVEGELAKESDVKNPSLEAEVP